MLLGLRDQPRRQRELRRLPARRQPRSAASTPTSTAATTTPTAAGPAATRDRHQARLPAAVRPRTRWTTSATATPTPTSCAPRASRTSCARPRTRSALGKVFGDRNELLKIFGRYTQTDIARDNDAAILRLIKLAYDSTKNPIHEVKFPPRSPAIAEYLEISPREPADDRRRVHRRRHRRVAAGEEVRRAAGAQEAQAHQDAQDARAKGLVAAPRGGRGPRADDRDEAAVPARLLPQGDRRRAAATSARARALYTIRDRNKNKYRAYRLVLSAGRQRPVLRRPGHDLEGAADPRQPDRRGAHAQAHVQALLRRPARSALIAWETKKAVYWVSNTLCQGADQPADDGHRPVPATDRAVTLLRTPFASRRGDTPARVAGWRRGSWPAG